jgi:hypothetical protein
VQTFLVANVVYFAMQTWLGWNALSTPLRVQLEQMPYSRFARAHTQAFATAHGLDVTNEDHVLALAKAFDALVPVYAKSLVIALVPMYALGVSLVLLRRRVGGVAVLVFSTHVISALLWTWGLVFLPLAELFADVSMSIAILVSLAVYQFFALQRAFGLSRSAAAWRSIALVVAFGAALFAYRLLLFLVVLHTLRVPGA